jgi:hypothetical protein
MPWQCLLIFCAFTSPQPGLVPDGFGGIVPFTNSRVMADGSLRPYDPTLDGPIAYEPSGPYIDPYPLAPPPAVPPGYWIDPNPTPQYLPDTHNWREPR